MIGKLAVGCMDIWEQRKFQTFCFFNYRIRGFMYSFFCHAFLCCKWPELVEWHWTSLCTVFVGFNCHISLLHKCATGLVKSILFVSQSFLFHFLSDVNFVCAFFFSFCLCVFLDFVAFILNFDVRESEHILCTRCVCDC